MKINFSVLLIVFCNFFLFSCKQSENSKVNGIKKDSIANKTPKGKIYLRGDTSPLDSGNIVADTVKR